MMKRITGRLATIVSVGVAAGLFAASGAWASDIVCKPTARESPVRCNNPDGSGVRCNLATDEAGPRARPRHLICDSSRLSERYERIYAEQQRMLRKGRIQDSDIAAWRSGAMPATRYDAWKACLPNSGGSGIRCESHRAGPTPRIRLQRPGLPRPARRRHRRLRRLPHRPHRPHRRTLRRRSACKKSRRRQCRLPCRPDRNPSNQHGRRLPLSKRCLSGKAAQRLPLPGTRTAARPSPIRQPLPWRACFPDLS